MLLPLERFISVYKVLTTTFNNSYIASVYTHQTNDFYESR